MKYSKHLVAEFAIFLTDTAISNLGLTENIHLRNKLINACINFRHYTQKRALKTLFILFYGNKSEREEVLTTLFYSTNHPDDFFAKPVETIPQFSEKQYQVIANEFLYQYEEANPEFMSLEEHTEYQNEFDDLKSIMSKDPVLFFRAVKQCELICHVEPIASNCIDYLSSKQKTSNMQALEMLGHNFQHRVLLLPYAKQIGCLLKAMHSSQTCRINRISPFEAWLSQHEEEKFINDFSTELPKVLLLDELVKFSDLISSLPRSKELNHYFEQISFDKKILLDSEKFQKLVKAIVIFLYKRQNYREAQAIFSLGDEESLYNFMKCKKDFESALAHYNEALDSFLAYCKT